MKEGKNTVLVVEDNRTFRYVMQEAMRKEGYEVVSAVNGVEALKRIEEAEPDVILLDQIMPEMDGITALHELKKRGLAKKTILMLVLDDPKIPANAEVPSAFAAFTKPFDLEKLCHAVKRCLQGAENKAG